MKKFVALMLMLVMFALPINVMARSCNIHCPEECDECVICEECPVCEECTPCDNECPDCKCVPRSCPDCVCECPEPVCNCPDPIDIGNLPDCPEFPDDRNAAFTVGYWFGWWTGFLANQKR